MKTGLEQIAEKLAEQINSIDLQYNDCKNKDEFQHLLKEKGESVGNKDWPFSQINWHYEGYVESLKKAGAFIAAELDRLQKS